jgi:ubiquinone biosynthesis protein
MAFGELGVVFIKLAQFLGTRPDVVPPEYVAELSKLQDAAPAVPYEQISQIIRNELGQLPDSLFATFDRQPLASASIGQVHAAALKCGEGVVVKIQRPGVTAQAELDLQILAGVAEWAEAHAAVAHTLNLTVLVDEFAYTLRNEMDYQREGYNADRFRRNFEDDASIHIPRICWDLSTSRVLTMERVGGIKIADVALLDQAGISRRKVAENAVHLMMREVYEFGFFHADPHPGNFYVQPDGSISLIDFGMVGRLDERLQDTMTRMGLAIVRQDAEQLADDLYALGVAGGQAKHEALQRDLAHLLDQYAGQPIQDLAAARVTNEVMAIAFRHHLQLPGELAMLFRVIGMSEALGAQLDPNFKLFEFLAPQLQQLWFERRSPVAVGKKLGLTAVETAELAFGLPRRLSRLLSRVERGEIELNVNHEGLHELIRSLQRMTNRLALAVLLSATLVALGLMMVVYHPPGWEQYAGYVFGFAFFLALGFGALLMWRIWRAGR